MAAYGGSNRTTGDLAVIGSHDLSARTVGFAGGFDYRLTPDTVVGLAFAGGGTNWSLSQGLGGGKSDAFQAGIYGATKYGPAYLAAAFAFANHWMSTDRLAFGDHLTADFNAQSYGGRLDARRRSSGSCRSSGCTTSWAEGRERAAPERGTTSPDRQHHSPSNRPRLAGCSALSDSFDVVAGSFEEGPGTSRRPTAA